jgi:vancomycin resistance protein YoaR
MEALIEKLTRFSVVVLWVFLFSLPFKANAQDNFSVMLSEKETTYLYKGEKLNRALNVELAASKINGVILQPGEIFSYNNIVGNRTYNNGFKDAPVIISGELVDGIGGGVCQVAGTVHAAMLNAGLQIVEATQHSRTSTYIDPGLDSTVAWPTKDLKFQNWLPFPVKITTETSRDKKRGHLIVRFWGLKKHYNVEIKSIIHYKSKVRTKRIYRSDLPRGYKKIIEIGTPTIRMTRIRHLFNDNEFIEESKDIRYTQSEKVIEIGTKDQDNQ